MRPKARRVGVTSKSVFYAIIVHVAAGVLLVLNIDWPTHVVSSPRSEPAPVQASVVSEAEIQKQMAAIEEKEQAEQRRQQEAQEKLEELLQQKEAEEQRLAEIKERQEQERREAEELAKRKEQEQQELARLQEEEERKRQEEEERRRQEEAERQRQEKAERKRQEEAERQRQAEEERKRREAEEQRQRELAAERERQQQLQQRLEQERLERRVESALSQYIPIIQQKVGRNWNRPAGLRDNIEAHVNVRLSQTGEVISARIVRSSGNAVFDRSVENAVLKASPLPIPQEQGVNEEFRNMTLRFRPQDMIS